ncbi:MAG: penicillin acylase family protein [Opitutaceae bacterium]|nr:penicillin acylase family protein [Opitutaceae bacterium]
MATKRIIFIVLATAGAAATGWALWLRNSAKPWAFTQATVAGLSAPVEVVRDARGVPLLRAKSRLDAVRALGFAHAVDRLWQMDLNRRAGLGARAELLGAEFAERDQAARLLGLPEAIPTIWEGLPADQRARLEAYADGVNAGIQALGGRSAFHRALGAEMRPWQPQDALLVALGHFVDLQPTLWTRDERLGALRDRLGLEWAAFFSNPFGTLELPGPKILSLGKSGSDEDSLPVPLAEEAAEWIRQERRTHPVDGLLSEITQGNASFLETSWTGPLAAPSPFYAATLEFFANDGSQQRVTGLSWPGLPLLVIGTNGKVAWGVIPLNADTTDLILLPRSDIDPEVLYVQGKDILKLESSTQKIRVRGEDPRELTVLRSQWGAVVGRGEKKQYLAVRSTATQPGAINLALAELELSTDTHAAAAIAESSALKPMRLALADVQGNTVQTAIGRVPERVGYDGQMPVYFAYGDRRWEKLVPAQPYSTLGASGAMCSVGGEPFSQWQDLFAQVIQGAAPRGREKEWEELRSLQQSNHGAYLLAEAFGRHARARILAPILRSLPRRYENFEYGPLPVDEAALRIVRDKPAHLLDPRYESWEAVLVNAAIDTLADLSLIDKALDRKRVLSLTKGIPFWASWPFAGAAAPLPPKAHIGVFPDGGFVGESVRALAGPSGALRLSLPGGPAEHPASAHHASWHAAWADSVLLESEPAADAQDAVLLQP